MTKLGTINTLLIFTFFVLHANFSLAQKPTDGRSWQSVATGMPDEWYGSDESVRVAENVLLYQRNTGGWPKNLPIHKPLTESEKTVLLKEKYNQDAIFDNGATTTEIRFLAMMYGKTQNDSYKIAVEKGLRFILEAQYENGGWPMFYPLRKGYYTHITFNDDATFRLMKLLKEVYARKPLFAFLNEEYLIKESEKAWKRGLECILKTQIVVGGKLTVWCAQHDENTFLPAKARAYELPSFSGAESVGLLEILMGIENPSHEIIRAVRCGIEWLDAHRLKNIRWDNFINAEGKKDRRIISDPLASDLWARFYDLKTGLPYVSDRDGIKKSKLEEIGYERRNGYNWYTNEPEKIIRKYPEWKARWQK
ncbi:MAG: pectate lyase [Bacteroidota bacterium]|nr:pectate lyase [Odoribacter sp.]MDP3644833.1 pectate lyase [Bacteroidota bacterium]